MKQLKSIRLDETAIADIEELKEHLRSQYPLNKITDTDIIHRAIYAYYWAIFGTWDAFTEYIKKERGE